MSFFPESASERGLCSARWGQEQGQGCKDPVRAISSHPMAEGDPSTASQRHLAYRSQSASQHALIMVPTPCDTGCKSSYARTLTAAITRRCYSLSSSEVTARTNIMVMSKTAGSPENIRSPVFMLPGRQKHTFLSSS